MISNNRLAALLLMTALLGCGKLKSLTGGEEADASGPAASASGSTATPSSEVCTVTERKVWATNSNRGTGLTARSLGNRMAVGVGIGNRPAVLLFDDKGKGELANVTLAPGSELAKDIPSNRGKRELLRVTPALNASAAVTAYADYRDKYEPPDRRRIACELAETRRVVLVFDGEPLLDGKKDKPEGKPDAGAKPSAFSIKIARAAGKLKAVDAGAAAAPPPPPPPPAAAANDAGAPPTAEPKDKKKPLREIRDCRTLIDDKGGIFGVGSELYGKPEDDGSTKWSMRLFVAPNAGNGYYLLNSSALPKEPKDLSVFESAWAKSLSDGTVLLTARYKGSLFSTILTADHKPTGKSRTFAGASTMPALVQDGDDTLILTSQNAGSGAAGRYDLHMGKASGKGLPQTLDLFALDGMGPSLAEPALAIVNGQRWISVNAGSKREAQLVLVPVDASLKRSGKTHALTNELSTVLESRLFALANGQILAVYIEATSSGDELTSQVLSCQVKT
jgi:hypothetical protein